MGGPPEQRLLLPLLLTALASALRTPASGARSQGGAAERGGVRETKRLAVLICGLQDRLLWRSKVEQVLVPASRAGHHVDVFVNLVRSGSQDGRAFTHVRGQVKSLDADIQDLPEVLDQEIGRAGGRLAHFLIQPEPEDVRLSSRADYRRLPKRLPKYPPTKDPIGRNVLRRYKTVEHLMRLALDGGTGYDFVLWTRDDDHWLGPLNLDRFLADSRASGRVYSKGCFDWDGINDKTLLFGWAAAKAMLARLYSDFWLPDPRLAGAKNAEAFLKAFAEVKGVEPVAVPFGELPTADSVYVRALPEGAQPKFCQKDQYLCPELPEGPGFERPVPCNQLPEVAQQPGAERRPSVLAVVNYWVYSEPSRRKARAEALNQTLQALAQYDLRHHVLLVTNELVPEVDGLVAEQIVRRTQRCSPALEDPLCMAWEAMRVLRNASTGGPPGCDLWSRGACGELQYDFYMYLEGDIKVPPETFYFWARHVDVLFKQAYVLVPHREEPFEGEWKLTECLRNHRVDHLAKTLAVRDTVGAGELYDDPHDRVYLLPPVPYSACLLMSRWQFEVYLKGNAWNYDTVARTMQGGKIREAAIRGLLGDARLARLRAVTHLRLPVLHQQPMTGVSGLYPDMCGVDDYRAKVERCLADAPTCPAL